MIDTLFHRVLSTIQYHQFIAGLFGGIISSIVLHPFDLIKIRFQVTESKSNKSDRPLPYRPYYNNFVDAFRSIYREKGLQGLYEGVTPNVVGNGISWGLYLFIYNTIVVLNNDEDKIKSLAFLYRVIYSTTAGLLTIILTNPIWVIKTRMCLQYSKGKSSATYDGMLDAFRKTYQNEGIQAFYKGLTPGLFGIFHGTIQFSSYEQMKSFYMNAFGITYCPTPIILTFSALSKFIAATSTYPTQVVRTRLQDQHQHYNGAIDAIKKTYEGEGISGFFKGVVPALYRVIPASCITFGSYEFILRELKSMTTMPKSKEFVDNSDSEERKNSGSEEEKPKASTSKKSKNKITTNNEDPPAKRAKPNDDTVASIAGPSGERLYELGKLRYISVSEFKGKSLINIREYYEDKGVHKPGKKGISLSVDQWEKLKSVISQIDKDLK
ncbi:unnamed protein product [Rotaria socialis]|uniref:Transcriptional coactivator p15 (PC4) C-terminal domain-containing protein n=3 Tax=Rotaria socialis TaxID=392032 RepID=A0A820YWZ5_9BILA|nr:unnamed protein product [Rotaria socialis]CAF4302760.1 unnamed protein product [Rotaria socialis]CAF4536769.1 unnamed protein product [Rotaria socialis]CAF4552043.1 unnamed protein product [Rotaria socialis]